MRPSFQLLNYSYLSSIQIQEIGILRKLFCSCNSNEILTYTCFLFRNN